MLCSFKKLLYPKTIREAELGSYMIAVYTLHEKVVDTQQHQIYEAKVVGYYLPIIENIRFDMIFDMTGEWQKTAKYGVQFAMESYKEVVPPTRKGIVSYLQSGLIKGIGPKTAEKIFDAFGKDTLEILDKSPQDLLKVRGISEEKLKRICDSYIESRGAREIITFLTPYGVTPNKAVNIYKHFGSGAVNTVRNHPYRLCRINGFGFLTADRIAISIGLNPLSSERIQAGLEYTLKDAENNGGHLCLEKNLFIQKSFDLLATSGLTKEMIANEAFKLLNDKQLELFGDQVFRSFTARIERELAAQIHQHFSVNHVYYPGDLDADIDVEQIKLQIKLAPEQRQAIKTCITSSLSILTGGPGTGKTIIQKVLLDIYTKYCPDAKIICCAPTGRAARRMTQCTGFPASTIHKALNLLANEDGEFTAPNSLDADLILIDEVSMMDIYLAKHFFSAIPSACQVILIGDADQLPSVGPGAFISELIVNGAIPVVKLDKVYRQDTGSRIAINAKLIRHNNTNLEYGEDFRIFSSSILEKSADLIETLYLQEVKLVGIDHVALLTPFRQKTVTGVTALNERLRELINPADETKRETSSGKKRFREGDKVMWTKNKGDINNGDVGYISKITKDDEISISVDFQDGRVEDLDISELSYLELAYASTVHKAQGAEYDTVIINLQTAHYIMLKRPLLYTAITRAKKKVILIGDRKAICIAINTVDAEKRGTMLSKRIAGLCSACKKTNQLKGE